MGALFKHRGTPPLCNWIHVLAINAILSGFPFILRKFFLAFPPIQRIWLFLSPEAIKGIKLWEFLCQKLDTEVPCMDGNGQLICFSSNRLSNLG